MEVVQHEPFILISIAWNSSSMYFLSLAQLFLKMLTISNASKMSSAAIEAYSAKLSETLILGLWDVSVNGRDFWFKPGIRSINISSLCLCLSLHLPSFFLFNFRLCPPPHSLFSASSSHFLSVLFKLIICKPFLENLIFVLGNGDLCDMLEMWIWISCHPACKLVYSVRIVDVNMLWHNVVSSWSVFYLVILLYTISEVQLLTKLVHSPEISVCVCVGAFISFLAFGRHMHAYIPTVI